MGNVKSCVRTKIDDWDYHGATVAISLILGSLDSDDRSKVLRDMFLWYPNDVLFDPRRPCETDKDVSDTQFE